MAVITRPSTPVTTKPSGAAFHAASAASTAFRDNRCRRGPRPPRRSEPDRTRRRRRGTATPMTITSRSSGRQTRSHVIGAAGCLRPASNNSTDRALSSVNTWVTRHGRPRPAGSANRRPAVGVAVHHSQVAPSTISTASDAIWNSSRYRVSTCGDMGVIPLHRLLRIDQPALQRRNRSQVAPERHDSPLNSSRYGGV